MGWNVSTLLRGTTVKAINTICPARQLSPGDLWVRPLDTDEVEVVQVTHVQRVRATKARKESIHVTYDALHQWANEAAYTEALRPDQDVHTLVIAY
jgi:hypothetical protein